jgi:hypothetical protein
MSRTRTYNEMCDSLNFYLQAEKSVLIDETLKLYAAKQLIIFFQSYSRSNEFAIGKHLENPQSSNPTNDSENILYHHVGEARKLIAKNETDYKSFKELHL